MSTMSKLTNTVSALSHEHNHNQGQISIDRREEPRPKGWRVFVRVWSRFERNAKDTRRLLDWASLGPGSVSLCGPSTLKEGTTDRPLVITQVTLRCKARKEGKKTKTCDPSVYFDLSLHPFVRQTHFHAKVKERNKLTQINYIHIFSFFTSPHCPPLFPTFITQTHLLGHLSSIHSLSLLDINILPLHKRTPKHRSPSLCTYYYTHTTP